MELGYHKLGDPAHWPSIQAGGINPAVPAEKHWLGDGVYFFLNPNGLAWAIKWPHKPPRRGSEEGIILADLDTTNSLDFRDEKLFQFFRSCVATVRGAFTKQRKPYSDGRAIAQIFKMNLIARPKCIVANFDSAIREGDGLLYQSRFILKPTYCLPPYSETTQIQVCVLDKTIISNLRLHEPLSAV